MGYGLAANTHLHLQRRRVACCAGALMAAAHAALCVQNLTTNHALRSSILDHVAQGGK